MSTSSPPQIFYRYPLLPHELQIHILRLALLLYWPSAQLELKWLSPQHGTLMHNQLPILTSPTTHQAVTSFSPCCSLDTSPSPGKKVFRNHWLQKSEADRAVIKMMHINKLSRHVVLEHWRRELVLTEFRVQELVLARYEHESRDNIIGVMDELLNQTRRPLPSAPTAFHRFSHLPTELKVKVWQEVIRDHWCGSAFSNLFCLTLTPWLGKGDEVPILVSSSAAIYTNGTLRANGSSEIAIMRVMATDKLSRHLVLDQFRNYLETCNGLKGLRESVINVVEELLGQSHHLKL